MVLEYDAGLGREVAASDRAAAAASIAVEKSRAREIFRFELGRNEKRPALRRGRGR